MSFNMNMLSHLRAITECLPKFRARSELKVGHFRLEIRANGRYYDLIPQYAKVTRGRVEYTPILTTGVDYFIGWRHYFNRQWALSNDKITFKTYCRENGLRAPAIFTKAEDVTKDVIIKRTLSSFGDGIQGPFRPDQVGANPPLANGEYYDEFVPGEIAKIWYWNDKVVALEAKPMVHVTGDGERSLRELIVEIKSRALSLDWAAVETVVRYQKRGLDDVVPAGESVLVDFRYLSALHPYDISNHNILNSRRGTAALAQLERAGPVFWKGIPEDIRQDTLYTIDAIIDLEGNVAYLEMNSNPVVHPDAYVAMFESLFQMAPIEMSVIEQNPRPIPPSHMPPGVQAPVSGPAAQQSAPVQPV